MPALRWEDFMRRISKVPPRGFYAFCGPELYLKAEAIAAIKRALAGAAAEASSARYAVDTHQAGEVHARDVSALVSQAGLFGGDRLILIENLEKLARAGKQEREIWLGLVRTTPANPVVFLSDQHSRELERRAKFLAELLRAVQRVDFWYLRPADARRWVARAASIRGLVITPPVAAYLVDHLGTDLQLLSGEIEKISLLHGGESPLGIAELRDLVRAGILGSSWECANAIMRGDLAESFERLREVRREESAFGFLWKLGYATGNALGGRAGGFPGDVGGHLGSGRGASGSEGISPAAQRSLAQLLRGCYQWERFMKGGVWSGRHDFAALEGVVASHALRPR